MPQVIPQQERENSSYMVDHDIASRSVASMDLPEQRVYGFPFRKTQQTQSSQIATIKTPPLWQFMVFCACFIIFIRLFKIGSEWLARGGNRWWAVTIAPQLPTGWHWLNSVADFVFCGLGAMTILGILLPSIILISKKIGRSGSTHSASG